MGTIATEFSDVYRDYVTDGIPSSGIHEPVKSEIRALGVLIDAAIGNVALGALITVAKDTRANLNADLAYAANVVAIVYADATDANNDLYIKVGASGAGSWTLTTILHDAAEAVGKVWSDLAQAWAEGTLPGGAGTKSAKEHALDAEASATTATSFMDLLYTSLSGYSWGVKDEAGRVALGITPAGHVNIAGSDMTELAQRTFTYSSRKWAWGVIDASGRVAIGLDMVGNLYSKGNLIQSNFQPQITALQTVQQANVTTTGNITCWGDSLTYGDYTSNPATDSYPAQLQTLFGSTRTVTRKGFSGYKAEQIATRQGGIVFFVSVAGNQIPASGAVAITPVTNDPAVSTVSYQVTIAGVAGTLTQSSGTYSFTRTASGSAVPVSAQVPVFFNEDALAVSDTVVIWAGQNNGYTDSAILTSIAAMVDHLKASTKRFVVMSIIGRPTETVGAPQATLLALNKMLLETYPRNFLDIRTPLVRAYDPGIPQDVTDFGNNIVPTSLRISTSDLHLNQAGYAIVAPLVYNFIITNGW